MSDPINDKELDEYLAGGSAVSRRYRELGADDVPVALDRVVLQRARAEVARPSRAQRWRLWSVPVALAASVVLVVAILIEPATRHQSVVLTEQPTQRAPAVPAAAAPEHMKEIAPEQGNVQYLRGVTADAPPPESVDQISRDVAPHSPTAALPKATGSTQQATTATRAASGDAQGSTLSAVVVAPPAEVKVQASRVYAERSSSPPQAAEAPTSGAIAATQSDTSHELSEVTVTSQRRARAETGGVGPRNTIPRRESDAVDERFVGAAAPAPAAANQPTASGTTAHDDPARWLDTIRQLRKDGKVREADEEWERFRAAFPDYAVEESDSARPKH